MKHLITKLSLGLLAGSYLNGYAEAACTPSPDCASLGFNQSSCPTGDNIIRCPFDSTKVSCIPKTCESIGKKTCGENCVPASYDGCCVGYIYYSDKTCSADLISGKTPIGVVGFVSNNGKNGIVVEKDHSSDTIPWGCVGTDLACITNIPGSDGGANPELRADYNGEANTKCIVNNNCFYAENIGAGVYCSKRNIGGVTGWYLPAGGELYDTMIENRTIVNIGLEKISGASKIPVSGQKVYYWSSSEQLDNPRSNAWYWYFSSDKWYWDLKLGYRHVRCVLAF